MAAQIELKLDVYLHDDDVNNEVITGPEDMYVDDEYQDNISQILCKNLLTVNGSFTAEDMLYLDTNFGNCPQWKRHQKEPLLNKSENKKPNERVKLRQKQKLRDYLWRRLKAKLRKARRKITI